MNCFSRISSLDVSSIEDVYWLEDKVASHTVDSRDMRAWSLARQSLPTGSEALATLKANLWSSVVKNCRHQDAWTWGQNLKLLFYRGFSIQSPKGWLV